MNDSLRIFHPTEVLNLDCLDFEFIQYNEIALLYSFKNGNLNPWHQLLDGSTSQRSHYSQRSYAYQHLGWQ